MYVALVYAGILVSMVDSSMRAQPEYRLLNRLNLKSITQKFRWHTRCSLSIYFSSSFTVRRSATAIRS